MARIYPYDDSPGALLSPAKGLPPDAFFQDSETRPWTDADIAQPFLLCAEMSRLAYAEEKVVIEALKRIGFTKLGWLRGNRPSSRVFGVSTDGFVARDDEGRTVVVFRGTEADRPEDVLADLLTAPTAWDGGGHVHTGFKLALAEVQDELASILGGAGTTSLLVTGHSLGAGLATLVAAQLASRNPTLVTFGSPRVGDAAFVAGFPADRGARFVNCCDVVARVPPEEFDGAHVGKLLGELTGVAAASLLSFIPSALSLPWHFRHVGPARYVNAQGRVADGVDAEADQEAARAEYRKTHGAHLIVTSFVDAVHSLIHALGGSRDTIREAGAKLFGAVAGRGIPIRDLADHAPINYVSAMARSFR
jgi:hypothetical protein